MLISSSDADTAYSPPYQPPVREMRTLVAPLWDLGETQEYGQLWSRYRVHAQLRYGINIDTAFYANFRPFFIASTVSERSTHALSTFVLWARTAGDMLQCSMYHTIDSLRLMTHELGEAGCVGEAGVTSPESQVPSHKS